MTCLDVSLLKQSPIALSSVVILLGSQLLFTCCCDTSKLWTQSFSHSETADLSLPSISCPLTSQSLELFALHFL